MVKRNVKWKADHATVLVWTTLLHNLVRVILLCTKVNE